jgi:hypothetical protein
MSFECRDLDQVLETGECRPEAGIHFQQCAPCRERMHLWSEISAVAPQLRQEWESPALWSGIEAALSAKPQRSGWWRWAVAAPAAAGLLFAAGLFQQWAPRPVEMPQTQGDFLTAETLKEVQKAEAAYRKSIARLSALAGTTMQDSPTMLAAVTREKLALLDSAIAELRSTAENNAYNAHLQTQLASLYEEKRRTLEDWVAHANSN